MAWTVQLLPLRRALLGALGAAGAASPAGCLDRTLDKDDAAEGSGDGDGDGEDGTDDRGSDSGTSSADTTGESQEGDGDDAEGEVDDGEGEGEASGDDGSDSTTGPPIECIADSWDEVMVMVCYPPGSPQCDGTCDDACRVRLETEQCGCSCDLVELCGFGMVGEECCFTGVISDPGCEGRPFVVDDRRVLAPTVEHDGWFRRTATERGFDGLEPSVRRRLGEHFSSMAAGEHASVPAFARCLLDLVGLGAPVSIVEATQRALAEEIEHAKVTFGLASALLERSVGPAALPEALAASGARTAERILADVLREGCIGETISAAVARIEASTAGIGEIRRALETIAEDETNHAALAWRTAAWLLQTRPELRSVAEGVFAEVEFQDPAEVPSDPTLVAHGLVDRRTRHEIARACWQTLIRPAAARLLAS